MYHTINYISKHKLILERRNKNVGISNQPIAHILEHVISVRYKYLDDATGIHGQTVRGMEKKQRGPI